MTIVSARYGKMQIIDNDSVISRSLRLYGEWAQDEIDLLTSFIRAGSVVVDAGAFIGTHARAFSAIVGASGKIFAFEPRQETAAVLSQNAELATVRNIVVLGAALGASENCLTIPRLHFDGTGNFGASTLGLPENEDDARETVVVRPLDYYGLDRIDFLKIDVEGMELDVLEGARETVERCQPVIFVEANSLESAAPIIQWCRKENYKIYGVLSAAYNASNFAGNSENIFASAQETGMLLVPLPEGSRFVEVLSKRDLPTLETIDDLALLLLHKPQYPYDVFSHSSAGAILSLAYPSPQSEALNQLISAQASQIGTLQERLSATEQAKEFAEQLAIGRLGELSVIRGSAFWRIGVKLRLAPHHLSDSNG